MLAQTTSTSLHLGSFSAGVDEPISVRKGQNGRKDTAVSTFYGTTHCRDTNQYKARLTVQSGRDGKKGVSRSLGTFSDASKAGTAVAKHLREHVRDCHTRARACACMRTRPRVSPEALRELNVVVNTDLTAKELAHVLHNEMLARRLSPNGIDDLKLRAAAKIARDLVADAVDEDAMSAASTSSKRVREDTPCIPNWGQSAPFFFSISRSMPTANADDPCRSEGTSMRVSPRPFRRHPPIRSSRSAFAVGMRRRVVKNRSAAGSLAAQRRRLRKVRRQDTPGLGQARLLRSRRPRDAQPTPGQRRFF